MDDAPFGPIDPNSQHQLWSRWVFGIQAGQKRPPVNEVSDNARRFLRRLFHTDVGRVRCDEQDGYYAIVAEVEGISAHDCGLVASVKTRVNLAFIAQGFGNGAKMTRFEVSVMAGDQQDGKPPEQWIVMPPWDIQTKMFGE